MKSNVRIVANALTGNVPNIPFIRIENPDGTTYFYGTEDYVWGNKDLLNARCIISFDYDIFVCRLLEKHN